MSKKVEISQKELEIMQFNTFKISSLAKVLKLASATSYVEQLNDDDIAHISEIIIKLSDEISSETLRYV